MANSFDQFPLYDPVSEPNGQMTQIWRDSISTFWQNLTDYINQYGFVLPNLTQAQIDSIQSPQNGQTVYNVTMDTAQYYKTSSKMWVSYP